MAIADFLTADEPRLKLTFELWRRLITADREGFAAHFDAPAQGVIASTNWEGLARQVELDLWVEIPAETNRLRRPARLPLGISMSLQKKDLPR